MPDRFSTRPPTPDDHWTKEKLHFAGDLDDDDEPMYMRCIV